MRGYTERTKRLRELSVTTQPSISLERAHRLHHYRNENYWMGVTNHLGDHVLGTFPNKDDVPVSPTAKTLGISASD